VNHTVEIFREIHRVLRPDGVCFLNLADTMASGRHDGLKAKNLCLVPFRVALALQADGWWIRSDIILGKTNPMPESVRDRPTDCYEHIFMLTKSTKYFWDAEAVKEPQSISTLERFSAHRAPRKCGPKADGRDGQPSEPFSSDGVLADGKRNLRNLWMLNTEPFPGQHYATFSQELVIRCLQAATSERGCCAECGAPWERIVEREKYPGKDSRTPGEHTPVGNGKEPGWKVQEWLDSHPAKTLGWRPTCSCYLPEIKHASSVEVPIHAVKAPVPCLVLDPFVGSGTTCLVAFNMGRRAIGCDISQPYLHLARERIPRMAEFGFTTVDQEPEHLSSNNGQHQFSFEEL
jgi:DNA modification methylase